MNETKMEIEQMSVMPLIPLRGMTILPDTVIHFDLNREKSIKALEYAMVKGGKLFLVTQRNVEVDIPKEEELYRMGTIAEIKQITKLPNQIIRVLVEGIKRGILKRINEENTKFLEAYVEDVQSVEEEGRNAAAVGEAMIRQLREYFAQYAAHYPKIDKNAMHRYANVDDAGSLMDQIAMNLPISYGKKQQVLEAVSLKCRYDILCVQLLNEIEVAKVREELAGRMKERVDKSQKEYLLREQLRYIREELGEDKSFSDADQFEASLNELQASEEVKARIKKEISRFKSLIGSTSESAVERAYIETLLELPWDRASNDTENIKKAKDILEREHYGLEQVKERILEFLAVRCLTKKGESPIICLVGPPGTGKTSIAKSVAEALNKKYVRICLGGVRDEAEIRGHRKTYVGAMPGRIASGLKQAGVNNPLMLLDEIDKVSNDHKGDTFSALLEVLDGEQNVRFRDHYVEIPLDLSEVLFMATANTTQTIPRPLLDRMEIIEVNSYTENEKFHIAREHLLKKQLEKNGITKKMLLIQDGALKNIITYYTKEAGVRELERKIGDICRKCAKEILEAREEGAESEKIKVTASNLDKYLGNRKYSMNKANKEPQAGIVRGLAWTSVGGDTLQIEVNMMPGKGEIELTGQMGDVMKESAVIGISYVRSVGEKNHIQPEVFKENDFHIHIPEGAVPKDGPSAGITMATALFSAISGEKVRSDIAMTGEITLRGRVLPVGGLKEKILAAKMAGMKEVLVPAENKKDIEEIKEEIREGLVITYVKDMNEVLKRALI
ncbi:MAG: endopeptidase La [Lachnospiraceae bacterium]|jgi:ATP-dependent Lon protease|nr:endopeptidase La [Lachnospiraceae bacterium]